MSNENRKLVETFEAAARSHLSFMIDEGFEHAFGLSQGVGEFFDLSPVHYESLPWPLAVCHHFRRGELGVEIVLNNYEFILESRIWFLARGSKYGLWELCAVNGRETKDISGANRLQSSGRLAECIEIMANSIHANLDIIQCPTDEMVEQMNIQRRLRQAKWKEEDRESDMRRAIFVASELFSSGKYSEVVAQLEPFRDILPPAQQKKLSMAVQRAGI
jgi:hypothetical protein